jgi:hypothetical protein
MLGEGHTMKTTSRFLCGVLAVTAALALAVFALRAHAQDAGREPTISQIYQAANSGQLDRADAMIAQVLKDHPTSAKAHYVKAELAARERQWDVARAELATAEKIAPGLPFAKAESVQALRNQLANASNANAANTAPARHMGAPAGADNGAYSSAPAPAQRGFPWGALAVVALIFIVGIALLRRRQAALSAGSGYAGAYGNTSAAPYGQTGYGPVYPPAGGAGVPPGYGYGPQQPSMGSSIARGLGTGLAIGAGAVAAEEIGRRMFGHDANAAPVMPHDAGNTPSLDQIDEGMRRNLNTDMGGNDFGIAGDGWDDASGGGGGDFSAGDVGGGDWDT